MCKDRSDYQKVERVALVLFYYAFSIPLLFYNRQLFGFFKFPLFVTTLHLALKFLTSWLVRTIWTCSNGERRVVLPLKDWIINVAPTGITASLDIAFSNWSLEFITISLYTMSKSSVIVFILIFSFIFKIEKPFTLKFLLQQHYSLALIVFSIAVGLFLFNYNYYFPRIAIPFSPFLDACFLLTGIGVLVLHVMMACVVSGVRWCLAQITMQKADMGVGHPLDFMFHVQPPMIITILPLVVIVEGADLIKNSQLFAAQSYHEPLRILLWIVFGSFLAFMLEFAEYLLVSRTSSLTLSISGIVKEIFTLLLAVVINGDQLSVLNCVGLIVCLSGISIHLTFKALKTRATEASLAESGAGGGPGGGLKLALSRSQAKLAADRRQLLGADDESDSENELLYRQSPTATTAVAAAAASKSSAALSIPLQIVGSRGSDDSDAAADSRIPFSV